MLNIVSLNNVYEVISENRIRYNTSDTSLSCLKFGLMFGLKFELKS